MILDVLSEKGGLVTAAPRYARDADIGLLGISHSEPPTLSRFPPTFNRAALPVWRSVVEGAELGAFKKTAKGTRELWTFAIQKYLKKCAEQDTFPFSNATDHEATARSFLKNARTVLVAFFNKHGIFDKFKIQRVERSFNFTDRNFGIECTAYLRKISDPTLPSWLTTVPDPGFKIHQDGVYRKSVHAHVDVEFVTNKRGEAKLTYRIFCHTPLHLIRAELPSRKRMASYADRHLWTPMIKEKPISGVAKKLF